VRRRLVDLPGHFGAALSPAPAPRALRRLERPRSVGRFRDLRGLPSARALERRPPRNPGVGLHGTEPRPL